VVGHVIFNLSLKKLIMVSKHIFFILAAGMVITSCKKTSLNPLNDYLPPVAVTVNNVFEYRPTPTVKSSKADNKITIVLQIPSGSGRTIKEITKVAAATTANYTVIQTATAVGTAGLYTLTPIPGSGTSVTFSTTFDEYKTKTGVTAVPASNALLGRDFYFVITLDDGQTIVTQNIRVWVVD
jgi:hypothetical protein